MTVPRERLEADIQLCRRKLTYHEKKSQPSRYKVQIRVQDRNFEKAIARALLTFEGVTQKLGAAPRSGLEREVQRLFG